MEITRTEECLLSDFKDGSVTFFIQLTTQCDWADEELNNAIREWATGDDDVYMNFRFSVRACVEDMIDLYNLHEEELVMSEYEKPMVDSLRAELLEMVALLDEVRFV